MDTEETASAILLERAMTWMERAEAAEARAAERDTWARAWKKCAKRYHDKANIAICTYCGHETPKDKLAMIAHMATCSERPDREDWETLREAMMINGQLAELEAAEARAAELERVLRMTFEWLAKDSLSNDWNSADQEAATDIYVECQHIFNKYD